MNDMPNLQVILLDLNLPDSAGLETVQKAHDIFDGTPIIVLTGLDNETLSLAAIQSGAQDYLVKNQVDANQLFKTIMYALKRHQALSKINEVSEKQKVFFSTHDVLTGLSNQQLFLEKLQLTIHNFYKMKQSFSLLLLKVNETTKVTIELGHQAKDSIIKRISGELIDNLSEDTFVSRYNENTFALLLTKTQGRTVITKELVAIQHALATSISVADQDYFPSYNIGIAVFPFDGQDSETLISSAYAALDRATQQGIKTYETFSKEALYTEKNNEGLIWHSDLQFALERQEFHLVYQPQINITTQKVIGVEALLRWHHPVHGMISPGVFIPIAEDSHLISAIGYWVIDTAATQLQAWRNTLRYDMHISINVSAQQLQYSNLVNTIKKVMKKYDIAAENLEVEVTESIFIDHPEVVIEKLSQLKELGIKISLDDFGRGYSSLAYLSHLPIDKLKLDIDFVQRIQEDSATRIIVKSTIDLAHSLNLDVIAEGVETIEQLELLQQFDCDEIQGYYFSKPIAPEGIADIINNNLIIPGMK
jgi:diguanylate cyclase (GGDEF)-like protein